MTSQAWVWQRFLLEQKCLISNTTTFRHREPVSGHKRLHNDLRSLTTPELALHCIRIRQAPSDQLSTQRSLEYRKTRLWSLTSPGPALPSNTESSTRSPVYTTLLFETSLRTTSSTPPTTEIMCLYLEYRYERCVCGSSRAGGQLQLCSDAKRTGRPCARPAVSGLNRGTCPFCDGVGQASGGAERPREGRSGRKGRDGGGRR